MTFRRRRYQAGPGRVWSSRALPSLPPGIAPLSVPGISIPQGLPAAPRVGGPGPGARPPPPARRRGLTWLPHSLSRSDALAQGDKTCPRGSLPRQPGRGGAGRSLRARGVRANTVLHRAPSGRAASWPGRREQSVEVTRSSPQSDGRGLETRRRAGGKCRERSRESREMLSSEPAGSRSAGPGVVACGVPSAPKPPAAREVFGRMGRGLRRYEWRACQVSVKAKFFEQG